ncbi:hypothetical protein CXF95_03740 [Paraglaciecola sp. MB-3u-78]|nr:hypothetical protein CXF95_03740 [Paraglaciecola sp. MB-3u-78]
MEPHRYGLNRGWSTSLPDRWRYFTQQKRATLADSPFFKWEPGNVLLSQEGGSGVFRSTAPATGTSQAKLESGEPLCEG